MTPGPGLLAAKYVPVSTVPSEAVRLKSRGAGTGCATQSTSSEKKESTRANRRQAFMENLLRRPLDSPRTAGLARIVGYASSALTRAFGLNSARAVVGTYGRKRRESRAASSQSQTSNLTPTAARGRFSFLFSKKESSQRLPLAGVHIYANPHQNWQVHKAEAKRKGREPG